VKVVWSPLALDRLEEIAAAIARDRPDIARDFVIEVFDLVETLAEYPRRGRVVPEVGREEIREVLFKGYRVIHRIEAKRIAVLTIRHGRQLLRAEEIP